MQSTHLPSADRTRYSDYQPTKVLLNVNYLIIAFIQHSTGLIFWRKGGSPGPQPAQSWFTTICYYRPGGPSLFHPEEKEEEIKAASCSGLWSRSFVDERTPSPQMNTFSHH